MATEEIKPWNATLHLLNSTGKAEQVFAAIQRRGVGLAGIIIAGWDEKEKLCYYLSEDETIGTQWQRFDDNTIMQNPRIFKTLKGILRKMHSFSHEEIEKRIREWFERKKINGEKRISETIKREIMLSDKPPLHIGLVFWQHPDAHAEPLEKYFDMVGIRLPGCPTQ